MIDSHTGQIAPATIEVSTIAHQYGEKPFQTNAAGRFFKVLDPGNYSIRVTLADGRQTTGQVTMQGQAQSITATVP